MMTLGLSPALAVSPSGAPAPPALPEGNLLLWTEAMDNAAWAKTGVSVTADLANNPNPPGDGSATADACDFTASGRILRQVTSLAASTGSSVADIDPVPAGWTRFSTTATFDIGQMTVSVYVQHVSNVGTLRLFLNIIGGFVSASLISQDDAVVANVWGWQLEAGASATAYTPRTT